MSRILSLASVLLAWAIITSGAGERIAVQTPLGREMEFVARSFEPGEIILVRLTNPAGAKKASIRFLGQNFELRTKEGEGEPFAFIGLDLGIRPGNHEIEISFLGEDGRVENQSREILVGKREFPVKKLWVKEEFVTPPPEMEERIRWEAELLETIYGRRTERWLGDGDFILPLDGKMAQNFGERRVYNNIPRSVHAGIDISAPFGKEVRASNSGISVLATDLYFSGLTVILDHGLGLFSYYCHFSELRVKRGTQVRKGEVIGLVGSTGRSTGPHLHWSVKVFQSRVDPLSLLSFSFPEEPVKEILPRRPSIRLSSAFDFFR